MVTRRITRRIHHRRSAQSIAVSLASRLIVKNVVRAWALQPNLHRPLGYVDGMVGLPPHFRSAVKIEPVRLEHCNAEWVRAPGVSPTRAILYLHGGAFLTCGVNTHRALVSRLSEAADAGRLPETALASDRGRDRRRPVWPELAAGPRIRSGSDSGCRRLGRWIPGVHDDAGGDPHAGRRAGRGRDRLAVHGCEPAPKTQAPQRTQMLDGHRRGAVDIFGLSRRSAAPELPGTFVGSGCLTGRRRFVGTAARAHPRRRGRVAASRCRAYGRTVGNQRNPLRFAPVGRPDSRLPGGDRRFAGG